MVLVTVGADLQAAVDSAAVTDIDNHHAGLVALHAVYDAPCTDADPQQSTTARERLDLRWCGLVGKIAESSANAVANGRVEGCVLLAGSPGQFDLVGGHLPSALSEFGVNVSKPVGAPVVGVPLG
jgi:hypothetical protein